jgi:hypothetical protein
VTVVDFFLSGDFRPARPAGSRVFASREGFMVDDKDESAPDPWAGIDDDAAGQSADGFSFSFDAASEIADQPGLPAADEGLAAADEGAAAADDISAWLSEPSADAVSEAPLAIFPPEDVEDGDRATPETIVLGSPPADTMFEAIESEDLHRETPGMAEPPAGSSHVEVGTGFSGIVSPSEVDPTSGAMDADEWPEALAMDAASETRESALDDFAADDQPSFDASGFYGVSDLGEAVAPGVEELQDEAVGAADAVAVAATVAAAKPRAPARKQGGGIGQLIAIVLGGVMAIPITYAILIWGFQRDPFKLAGMMPEQVAFLLPQKLQPGFRKSGGPKLDAPSALDDLPNVADTPEPPTEPAAGDDPTAPAADLAAAAIEGEPLAADAPKKMAADPPVEPDSEEPATPLPPADDVVLAPTRPAEPPAPPEPEPLDLSALEAAVGEASAAFDELALADPEAPDRKKLLVAWYKRLAAAAEQLVLLEKVAVDSGRPLGDAAAALDPLSTGIAADEGLQKDLARLSGMWLGSKKRAVDGAMLLATFDGARQVGPYWSMLVTVDGAEPLSVNVISRTEPKIEPGERVLVTGVVFDGDVVWATDCRPLAKKAAPVEDLF